VSRAGLADARERVVANASLLASLLRDETTTTAGKSSVRDALQSMVDLDCCTKQVAGYGDGARW
jgi:hypothetical protein